MIGSVNPQKKTPEADVALDSNAGRIVDLDAPAWRGCLQIPKSDVARAHPLCTETGAGDGLNRYKNSDFAGGVTKDSLPQWSLNPESCCDFSSNSFGNALASEIASNSSRASGAA